MAIKRGHFHANEHLLPVSQLPQYIYYFFESHLLRVCKIIPSLLTFQIYVFPPFHSSTPVHPTSQLHLHTQITDHAHHQNLVS